ncbi:MAG: PLP-dependent transferase [Flavobacteriales bacterium]|nr:PLP-dependent transferase [Flavobacteriales bacterium]
MKKKKSTSAVRIQTEKSPAKEHSVPLYLTSSFVFDDAEEMRAAFADEIERPIYSRFSNPNVDEFTEKMRILEGAESGFSTASGMAAVFATFGALLKSGDRILSCRSIFGATHTLFSKIFPKWNIETDYVDIDDYANWDKQVKPGTKMVYVETPTNPGLGIIDLEWVAAFAKKHQLLLVVDNCFATPLLQRPIEWGADLVIHSATKFIDGQGRTMGGVVLGPKHLIKEVYAFCRSTGPALSPFNAYMLSKSLETLEVRMERQCTNALKLAQWMESRKEISKVIYPFLPSHPHYTLAKKQMDSGGALVTFELNGGIGSGRKFLDGLRMLSLTANLGDSRSIASHPSSTTHAKLSEEERLAVGITPGMVRISVGLEHIDDIISDVEQSLAQL